jgi:hypothetical protein
MLMAENPSTGPMPLADDTFRYRNGAQKNGVPIAEAISEIVAAVENHSQV